MIFGHFFILVIFPIEIPIEAEKIYHHGKELSYRENKMFSETSEAVGTIWEHAQKEFLKFLKIRITLVQEAGEIGVTRMTKLISKADKHWWWFLLASPIQFKRCL